MFLFFFYNDQSFFTYSHHQYVLPLKTFYFHTLKHRRTFLYPLTHSSLLLLLLLLLLLYHHLLSIHHFSILFIFLSQSQVYVFYISFSIYLFFCLNFILHATYFVNVCLTKRKNCLLKINLRKKRRKKKKRKFQYLYFLFYL